MQIHPDKARELAQRGASILLLDVPAGTRVGLDHQSLVVSAGFRGFKMVPPGPHFLSYNAASRSGELAPTVAILIHLAGREVLVRRWSPLQELLLPLRDEDEVERYAEGVRRFDFDAGLVPYPLDSYSLWQRLTPHVTAATLRRIAPPQGSTSVTAEADPALLRQPTAAEQRLDAQLQEERRPEGAEAAGHQVGRKWADNLVGRCRYTQLPRLQKGAGLSASELTAQNLDKSALLEAAIARSGGDTNELLGEFELAFASFLYGQSLEGFAQWKSIMQLALACERAALETHTPFFVDMLAVLREQLERGLGGKGAKQGGLSEGAQPVDNNADVGALIEELLPASFLQGCVGGFLEMLAESAAAAPQDLLDETEHLKQTLQQRMGMLFDVTELGHDFDDEDAPVIVEI